VADAAARARIVDDDDVVEKAHTRPLAAAVAAVAVCRIIVGVAVPKDMKPTTREQQQQ
jgi:hypothetical protein